MIELAEFLPGRTYAVTTEHQLNPMREEALVRNLERQTAHLRCKFVILPPGVQLIGLEEEVNESETD